MSDQPWEPEAITRLKRERAGYVQKRDELQADVNAYNGQIFKYDAKIKEAYSRMNGEASDDSLSCLTWAGSAE